MADGQRSAATSAAGSSFPSGRRALWVGGLISVAVVLIGSLLMLSIRDRLPDQIITHWGPDGPNDWQSFTTALIMAGAVVIGLAAVLAVTTIFTAPSTRHIFGGLIAGLAVFVGTIVYGTIWSQRTPGSDGQPVLWVLVGLGAALIVGGLTMRMFRPSPAEYAAAAPPPGPAGPRLDVPAGTQLIWLGKASIATSGLLFLGLGVLVVIVAALFVTPWMWLLVAIMLALVVLTSSASVIIDDKGARLVSAGLFTYGRVPLADVENATTAEVNPIREFGGYGWRIGRDGRRGFVTRKGEALVVTRKDAPPYLVTVDGAEEAAAVLNTLAARAR